MVRIATPSAQAPASSNIPVVLGPSPIRWGDLVKEQHAPGNVTGVR